MNRFKITQRFLMVAAFTALLCTNAAAFTVNVPSHGMTEAPSIHAWTNSGDLTSWPGQTPVNYFGGCWQYSFTPNVSPVYIIINDNGHGHQTSTITITDINQDYYLKWDEEHFNYYAYNYDDVTDGIRLEVNDIPSAVDYLSTSEFLYFVNFGDLNSVYVYVWDQNDQPLAGNWPGTPLSVFASSSVGNFYRWICPSGRTPKGVIFNDNNGFQSLDLKFENGAIYFLKGRKGGVAKYISKPVTITTQNFPDPYLYNQLLNFDADGNGTLTWRETSQTYHSIFTDNQFKPRGQHLSFEENISSFEGLDAFTRLTDLEVTHNLELHNMNFLNQFEVLENVSVNDCFTLTSVGTQNNEILKRLRVSDCKLEIIDVTKNPLLRELWCNKNRLHDLNLNGNDLLRTLNCKYNFIPELQGLEHSKNFLERLDYGYNPISNHPYWPTFAKLSSLGVASTGIENTFPLSNMGSLPMKELDCSYNAITSCDYAINWYRTLQALNCSHNQIVTMDINYEYYVFERLDCSHNNIKLFTSKLNSAGLKYLDCSHNLLSTQALHEFLSGGDNGHPNLEELHCSYNMMESEWYPSDYNFSQTLRTLNCSNNQLKKINVKGMNALRTLLAGGQTMQRIDALSSAPNLEWLAINGTSYSYNLMNELSANQRNQLKGLDISHSGIYNYTNIQDLLYNLPNLRQFFAAECDIQQTLNLTHNNQLTEIDVTKNLIDTIIYASYQPNFYSYLNVCSNRLTAMNVLPSWMLDCSRNSILTLDFNTYNIPLMVNCSYNHITSLDMSNWNGNPDSAPYLLVNNNVNNAVYGTLFDSPRYLEWFVSHYDVDDDDISVRYLMNEGCGQFHNNGKKVPSYYDDYGHHFFYLDRNNSIVQQYNYTVLDDKLRDGFDYTQMTLLTGGVDTTASVGPIILMSSNPNDTFGRITYRHLTGFNGEVFYGTEENLTDYLYGRDYTISYQAPNRVGEENVDYTNLEFYVDWYDGFVDVKSIKEDSKVVQVQYFNTLGICSEQPFEGVNIVVTRYNDGTTHTTKIVR